MESLQLRQLLAKYHNHRDWGILYTNMYYDDGELQCPHCGCDFLRDPAGLLDHKITVFNLKKYNEQSNAH